MEAALRQLAKMPIRARLLIQGGIMGIHPKKPAGRLRPEMRKMFLSVGILIQTKAPDVLIEEAIREHLVLLALKGGQELKDFSQWN